MRTRGERARRWPVKINIDYIARVEGEGSVVLDIRDGTLRDLKLNIWEPPRFFEGFLVGRKFDEVPDIVARICGICPVSHMVTSIRAIEKALGFTPSEEIIRLRKIMSLSQVMASHVVHLYVLVLPDYHKRHIVTGMEKEIAQLMRMKEALNGITEAFGGRALHPVAMIVGGFPKLPPRETILALMKGLEKIRDDALETLKMIAALDVPEFESDLERVALTGGLMNKSVLCSDRGLRADEDAYTDFFAESEISYSHAKRTVIKGRGSLMVGALSRLNLNFDALHPVAKEAARSIGFTLPARNPFLNNTAQAIEIVHGIEESIDLLDRITGKDTFTKVTLREGSGAAITEAPRGLLYHHYELNRMGEVVKANIVTPTSHNSLGLEESLKKLASENMHLPKDELILKCEMLVRAYDPCFSCSVH